MLETHTVTLGRNDINYVLKRTMYVARTIYAIRDVIS